MHPKHLVEAGMKLTMSRPQRLLLLVPIILVLLLLLLLRILPSSTSAPLLIFYDDVSTLAPAPSVPSSWKEDELLTVDKLSLINNISYSFHPKCNCTRQAPDVGKLQVKTCAASYFTFLDRKRDRSVEQKFSGAFFEAYSILGSSPCLHTSDHSKRQEG